jgi:hypothetical protein
VLVGDGSLTASTKTIACGAREDADFLADLIDYEFGGTPKVYFNTRAWYVAAVFNTAPRRTRRGC